MSIRRLSLITSLLLVACPADDADDTGNSAGTDPSSSSSTAPSTTEPGESSTLGTTEPGSSSGVDPSSESSSGAEESSTAAVDESSTGEPVAFVVTSPEFTEGGGLPHTAHINGGNISPALDWVGAPDGTMSFAVFLHDLDFLVGGEPFEHSAIWDIPSDATGLPADVDHDPMPADVPGAVQCENWTEEEYGYGGPGSAANHYEFIVYALDVTTLTEVDQESSLEDVFDALEGHSLGTAKIVGQSTGP